MEFDNTAVLDHAANFDPAAPAAVAVDTVMILPDRTAIQGRRVAENYRTRFMRLLFKQESSFHVMTEIKWLKHM